MQAYLEACFFGKKIRLNIWQMIHMQYTALLGFLRQQQNLILLSVANLLLHSAVSNVSGYRCESDCRSRGHEFDPGPVPYFRGDYS